MTLTIGWAAGHMVFDYLKQGMRYGTGWFARARFVALAVVGLAVAIGGAVLVGVNLGLVGEDFAAWLGFSLFPFIALVLLQVLTRMQATLTMRFGGRSSPSSGRNIE